MTNNVGTAVQCEKDLFCGVNTVADCEHMTDLEKKHQPIITAPKTIKKGEFFEVEIEIGKLLEHPNEPSHYIEFVELYADHTYLLRADFTACRTHPVVRAHVSLDHTHGKLRAFAHCNLHGTWEGQSEIAVTD